MYPGKGSPTFGIFVRNQVQLLKNAGVKVDVIAIDNQKMDKPTVIFKYLKWILSCLMNLIFKGRSYDVVHVHYVFPTGLLGLLYKMLYNKPIVVTAHGGDIDRMAKRHKYFKELTNKILKESSYIIAVGEQLYRNIIDEYNVPKEKMKVLNMGVDTNVFYPQDKAKLKEKHKVSGTTDVILFVGNFIKQKGIMDLVRAYKKLKPEHQNSKLVFIGAIKDHAFFEEVKEYTEKEGIEDIGFLGPMTQDQVADWMNLASVFVLPSHFEGLGLVALEAMACKTPVVGTRVGGLQYLLNEAGGMVVDPNNANQLKEAIEKVLTNEDAACNMIDSGFAMAQSNDSAVVTNKLINIYRNIK
ncbi:glycosyltransferase family 4 protein [Pseudalkalibacillus caeni]|uniref:Glycosyltransferase family 4 protein n=2 Tax=Exobacillus caeni TaxID=2574798 RepID=A0A5R9F3Y8_9BACL|nr:glycosyltransferase family 4 protein [Pseudalkalibacillus caeni]